MFRHAKQDSSASGRLHQALIESMPAASAYDPLTAASQLQALHAQRARTSIAAVAQVRLEEMKQDTTCQKRLQKIVDIERSLDGRTPQ